VATVVAILDRDAWSENTGVIVLADPATRSLTWIPHDLWCPGLRDCVNRAFAIGGNARLLAALRELGFPCDHAVCLQRSAAERALAGITIEVPVDEPIDLWYPLAPTQPIEEGRKVVSFRPPCERLEGERIHQWIGARSRAERLASDLELIARQQVCLRALLEQGFNFGRVIARHVRMSSGQALRDLQKVDAGWHMSTFNRVLPKTIDGKMVLVALSKPRHFFLVFTARLKSAAARLRRLR
jgi:hypothetical protein